MNDSDDRQPPLAARLPALARLGLTADELQAIERQGFLRREQRGSKMVYRLCFRHGGRNRTRYVRTSDRAAVEAELRLLQQPARRRRATARLMTTARQQLREHRRLVAPLFEAHGYYLHGQQVRKRRSTPRQET